MQSRALKKAASLGVIMGVSFFFGAGLVSADQFSGQPSIKSIQLAQSSAGNGVGGENLIQQGNQYRAEGDLEAAIEAFREAESQGLGDEALTLDIADTYVELGDYKAAYWEYRKVAGSSNPDTAVVACEAMYEHQWARNKVLPDPYFADLSISTGWQDIGDTAYIDSRFRIGGYTNADKPLEYYLFADFTRDNRSGVVGGFPVEYYENLAILGVGIQQPLLDDPWLVFIAEAGRARELEDFGGDRNREDYVAGFELYKDWNMGYDCNNSDNFPNRFVFSLSSELKYYSRYDDAWLFEIDARPGIRLVETRDDTVDAFVKLFHGANLTVDENNYSELGFGITWRPTRAHDFSITASINETYFDDGSSDTNYGIEFEYFVYW